MNLLWNKQVRIDNLWTPDCFGQFAKLENTVTFFFRDRHKLLSLSEEEAKPQLLHSCGCNERLPLPSNWTVVKSTDSAVLLVSDDRGIDLNG